MRNPSRSDRRRDRVVLVPTACLALLGGPQLATADDCLQDPVTEDIRQRMSELCEAAESGDPDAMYKLGVVLIEGTLAADYDQGVVWLRKASRLGSAEAGRLYNFIDSAQIGPGC